MNLMSKGPLRISHTYSYRTGGLISNKQSSIA